MDNKDIYNIDRIKAVADCRDIARSLGYELNKQDRSKAEYRNGEDPNVYFTKEYFSDKTDKKFKGDVFAFVQVANNCSFEEALKYVADFYNIKQTNEKQSESKQNEPFPYHKYEKPVVYDFSDTDDTLVLFEQRQYLKQEHKFDLYNGKKLRKKFVSLGHYDESGEKIYSIKDCRRIIYNRKAVPDSDTVFINEGPKGAEITNKLDLVGTAVICGANISWRPEYNKDFKDKNVVIIQDNDEQGAGFAQEVAGSLYGTANSIKIIIVSSEPKGDIEQFVESGGTKEKLLQLVKDTPKFKLKFQQVKTEKNTTGEKKQTREDVPEDSINRPEPSVKNVLLPSAYTPYIKSAEGIFSSLKAKKNMYIRGGKVQEVTAGEIDYKLEIINSHSFKSRIEQLGTTVVYKKTRQNTLCLEVKRPSKEDCESLLATPQINILPKINNIFSNPIIIPDGNGTKFLTKGYNPENGGIFISGGEDISKVEFTEARQAIIDLLCDFEFVTPSDLSRMLGAIITPALRFGRFTDEKCPIISFEANKEQAGKGFACSLITAIYGDEAALVAEKKGGVGSFDESLSTRLLEGKPFIQFDNLRGKMDSQFIEALLTAPNSIGVRVPHARDIPVVVRYFIYLATSNGQESTPDYAARSVITRIRKKQSGYEFKVWNGTDLITHIRENTAYYLGCVFSIIDDWYRGGAERTKEYRHDFRDWARSVDAIIKRTWPNAAPFMDNHQEAQLRTSNPALSWMRKVCVAVEGASKLQQNLTAAGISELCAENDVDIPGLRDLTNEKSAFKQVGTLMSKCFKKNSEITIDEYSISRGSEDRYNEKQQCFRPIKIYLFKKEKKRDSCLDPHFSEAPVSTVVRGTGVAVLRPFSRAYTPLDTVDTVEIKNDDNLDDFFDKLEVQK